MNKKIKIINRWLVILSCAIIPFVAVHSCTDNFEEFNTDKTQMMAVGPKQLAAMFSRVQFQYCSWLSTDNYSRMSSTVANHFSGYTACGIFNQEQNIMNTGWHNTGFNSQYTGAYPVVQSIMDVSRDKDVLAFNVALIWKVMIFHRITDIWGPVPYTEAGSGKEIVPYESQRDVYYKMFDDLNAAITALKAELQKNPNANVFGIGDMIYKGDVNKWLKLANTLRLRLAIRISNVDGTKAKLEAEAAAAGPLMEEITDDAKVDVSKWGSGGNGMPRMESFFQDVMSTSMESYMVGYNDPRITEYWSPVVADATMNAAGYPVEFKDNVGGYHGMTRGYEPILVNYLRAHSKYGPRFRDGNQLVTPINIINSAETWFLKAEGAWRGWNMGSGTAQSFYEKGIETSIKQWRGAAFPQSDINNYINSMALPIAPNNHPYYDPPVSSIPVKFSADRQVQYEQIITQKWLALFPVSFEAWAEYRRTRLPKLYPKKYSANANVDPLKGQIVTRLPFTNNEVATQPEQIRLATQMLGGPDLETTSLWWDVNKNGN
jgi:hypothetical protein